MADETSEPGGETLAAPAENGSLPRKTAAEILATADLPEGEIDVPAWGCSLLVRAIPKGVSRELRKDAMQRTDAGEDAQDYYERLLFKACVVDPVFSDEELDELFEAKNANVIEEIIAAIGMVLSGTEPVRSRQIQFRTGS